MTPPSLPFHLPLFLIYLPPPSLSILQYCLVLLQFKAQRMSASVPVTVQNIQNSSTSVRSHTLRLSLSFSRCVFFNTATPAGSSRDTKVIHGNFTRQELWFRSGATEKKSIFCYISLERISTFLKRWEERLHFSTETEEEKNVLVNRLHKKRLDSLELTEWGGKIHFNMAAQRQKN